MGRDPAGLGWADVDMSVTWGRHWDGIFAKAAYYAGADLSANGHRHGADAPRDNGSDGHWTDGSGQSGALPPDSGLDSMASHILTNKEIIETSRYRPMGYCEFLDRLLASDRPFNMVNVATVLYCAGKLRIAFPDHTVDALTEKVVNLEAETFSTRTLSNALYGLQRFTGTEAVRSLVAALTPWVGCCDGAFRAQHVGNTMYGIQRLGDSREVRALVAELAKKIARCEEDLNAQAVSNALYGMQNLGDSPEARMMMVALAGQIHRCTEELSAQNVGNTLYGMQNFTDSPELRQLLGVLIPLVEKSTAELNGQAIGNALYGMQTMGDTQDARRLMVALTPKLQQCCHKLKGRELNFVKYSLQRLPVSRELDGLVRALASKQIYGIPEPPF
jgi:hypothetical protein